MRFLFLVSFILFGFTSRAQLTAVKGKSSYNYWINLPADSILNSNPPILIFLHGRSLSGTDLNKVKRYGVICEIQKGRKIPAIVIAPQVKSGAWNPDKLLTLLEDIQSQYATDTNRVYVCGMSLGGYGTLHFIGKHPDKLAAGVALCGGGKSGDACNLSKVPLWIQHGTADKPVPVSESRKIVKAIKACDGGENLIYKEIAGASHGAMEREFRKDDMYDWLFSKTNAIEVIEEVEAVEEELIEIPSSSD
ncbi:MAG: prolyl oligopeptidase family serine peptidase [Crocinitomicaceae bacterium]|nr:prolyl oligopeptidase family serine peptidase [Flavobacteriales bacterium]NQZ35926.1 prolyl oligopeptidase family serine peptidase [Crocinitomicaceae bacterium]